MNAFTRATAVDVCTTTGPPGLVGPNAIARLSEALLALEGCEAQGRIFADAGLQHHLARMPTAMVDERDVAALHRSLYAGLGPDRAARISQEAGRLTGDYLLANRIPKIAQALLRILPRGFAMRLLLAAIARHAWTFAGSGRFSYTLSPRPVLRLEGSPVCRQLRTDVPACAYLAATFEHLFQAILGADVGVEETECEGAGAAACVFEVKW